MTVPDVDVEIRVYGCWSCRRTDVTLRNLGKNTNNETVYGCPEHTQLPHGD